jgi:phosphoribosylanthranilate isomerase
MTATPLFVKVCGITRVEDAVLASELGASAVGFIFWPGSPRYVTPARAREITTSLNGRVKCVGVFVNETAERIEQVADTARIDAIQLHGSESPDLVRQLAGARDVIKAVAIPDGESVDVSAFADEVLILLDAHDAARHGGTGRTIDWDIARRMSASRRTILSGGLNPDNVNRAVAAVTPYGVDVSSGVESSPGMKDPVRLKNFFEALNG